MMTLGPDDTTSSLFLLGPGWEELLPIVSVSEFPLPLPVPLSLPTVQETEFIRLFSFAQFRMKYCMLKSCLLYQTSLFVCVYNLDMHILFLHIYIFKISISMYIFIFFSAIDITTKRALYMHCGVCVCLCVIKNLGMNPRKCHVKHCLFLFTPS